MPLTYWGELILSPMRDGDSSNFRKHMVAGIMVLQPMVPSSVECPREIGNIILLTIYSTFKVWPISSLHHSDAHDHQAGCESTSVRCMFVEADERGQS